MVRIHFPPAESQRSLLAGTAILWILAVAEPPLLHPVFSELRFPVNRDRPSPVTLDYDEAARGSAAKAMCFFQYRIEHRLKVTGRGIDDAEHLGHRLLLSLIFITLGLALGKLTFEIGDPLLGIGERVVGRRAHFADLVGTDLPGGSYRDRDRSR